MLDREPFPGWDSGTGFGGVGAGVDCRQESEGPEKPEEDFEQVNDAE